MPASRLPASRSVPSWFHWAMLKQQPAPRRKLSAPDKADGKTLEDGLNLLDMEPIRLVSEKLLPSFTSYGMAMEYEVQVEIWGQCADREFSGVTCREKVQIVTDWTVPDSDVVELPVTPGPAYEEVDLMAAQELGDLTRPNGEHNGGATRQSADSLPAYGTPATPVVLQIGARSQPPLPPPPYVDGARWG